MNAHSPAPEQGAPTGLTDAVVRNVRLLRLVAGGERPRTKAAFAELAGKDGPNTHRAMKLLAEDGVLEGWDEYPAVRLTPLGERIIAGLDVIDGRAVLPPGWQMVRVDRIAPHPLNPRKDFASPKAAEALDALRVSILEHGVRYPPEVRPAGADGVHYLISGERRWRAVGLAIQEGDLPEDHELLVQIKPVDDEAHLVLALEENIQRSRLSYSEEAGAYAYFVNDLGWDVGDVADKFGRGKKHVQDYLRLLGLPPETLRQLDAGEIRYRDARAQFQDHREPVEPEPQLFDAAPQAPAPADPRPKLPDLSPKEALVLAELVDKAEREPAEGLEPGWTAVADVPADKTTEALIRRQMLAFRSRGQESYARAMIHSSGVKAWLEVNGFYEGVYGRQMLLHRLAVEVIGEAKADALAEGDRYATPWLNPVPEAEAPPPPTERKVQPGLVGDAFSEMMRRAREETDDGSGYIVPPPEAAAQAQAAEPAKPPVQNLPQIDARVVSATMTDVNDQLATWRGDDPHWMQRSEAELEADLLNSLERGAVVGVIALLTVLRERSGPMGACHVLARALSAYADKSREA